VGCAVDASGLLLPTQGSRASHLSTACWYVPYRIEVGVRCSVQGETGVEMKTSSKKKKKAET
jgi:hypothetical protein